jgi:hypothetical protein
MEKTPFQSTLLITQITISQYLLNIMWKKSNGYNSLFASKSTTDEKFEE